MAQKIITQTHIQAFERCRCFYYLSSVLELAWPVKPTRLEALKKGEDFHLLIRQLILGFPKEKLYLTGLDDSVRKWVDAWCATDPLKGYEQVSAEREVSALYEDVLWFGMFDALAVKGDQLAIFDWKTGKRKAPVSDYLSSPQTRLYRFLARRCGARLLEAGQHIVPAESVSMVYWFPEHPDEPVILPYSETDYQEDMTWLHTLAREMTAPNEESYPKSEKIKQCVFCDYYAYCHPVQAIERIRDAENAAAEMPDDEFPEDEIFQDAFPFDDIPADTDREETSF